MGHPLQNINQDRSQIISAFNAGLVATPFTGSTNDNVLLWDPANQAQEGPDSYIVIANSATLGTTATIFKAGRYAIELGVALTADAAALVLGISQDVAASGLTDALLITSPGALVASGSITLATDLGFQSLTTTAFVSQSQESAGSVIRFHAGTAAGGPPTIMLTAAPTFFRIRYLGENNINS